MTPNSRPGTKVGSKRRAAIALKLTAGVAVAAAGIGSVFFFSGPSEAKADRAGSLTSDRAFAKLASFDIVTTANGSLEAKNQIEVRSTLEIESKIVTIVDEGKTVKKGDVLVELNADKIDTAVADAQIALDGSNAEKMTSENNYKIQVTDNQTKIRQAALKVELAELSLEQWRKGDVEKTRQANTLGLEKTRRDVERLTEKLARSKELLDKGFLSKIEFQSDEIAKIEAESASEKAKLETLIYENYMYPKEEKKNQSDVDDAKAELERTKLNADSELANKEASLSKANKQLKQHQDNLEKFKKQRLACTVTAPNDGLVLYGSTIEMSRNGWSRNGSLQVGQEVYPNMLLVALPDTSIMIASVKVQDTRASQIKPGQLVTVRIEEAGGKVLNGKIESIGVMAESSGWRDTQREYTVKVALEDIDAASGLKPSMRCEAEILTGRVDNVLTVPVQAVFNDGAICFVYTPQGQKFVRTPVNLGKRSDATSEITAGITEGQVVLLREPTAGEVLSKPWDKAQLEIAGYTMGEDGVAFVTGKGPPGKGGRGKAAKVAGSAEAAKPAEAGAAAALVAADAPADVTKTAVTLETKVENTPAQAVPEKPAEKATEKSSEKPAESMATTPAAETAEPK